MEITDFVNRLLDIVQPIFPVLAVGLILVGGVSADWGYRLRRPIQAIQGFVLWVLIGCTLAYLFTMYDPVVVLIIATITGLCGAVLNLAYPKLSIFVMGMFTGGWLAAEVSVATNSSLSIPIAAVYVLLGGILLVTLGDLAVMVSSAITGSWSLLFGLLLLVGLAGQDPVEVTGSLFTTVQGSVVFFVVWGLLSAAGIIIQTGVFRKKTEIITASGPVKVLPIPAEQEVLQAVKLSGGTAEKEISLVEAVNNAWSDVAPELYYKDEEAAQAVDSPVPSPLLADTVAQEAVLPQVEPFSIDIEADGGSDIE